MLKNRIHFSVAGQRRTKEQCSAGLYVARIEFLIVSEVWQLYRCGLHGTSSLAYAIVTALKTVGSVEAVCLYGSRQGLQCFSVAPAGAVSDRTISPSAWWLTICNAMRGVCVVSTRENMWPHSRNSGFGGRVFTSRKACSLFRGSTCGMNPPLWSATCPA